MPRIQTIQVPNSGGGVNLDGHPVNIAPSECVIGSKNIRLEAEGYYPRNGYIKYIDDYQGGYTTSIAMYRRNVQANNRLVKITSDNKIWASNPASATPTWSQITQSLLTDPYCDMVSARDFLFLFNGKDRPIQIHGTTVTQPFTKPDAITNANDFLPEFGTEFYGALFVGGVPMAPDVVYTSKFSTAGNPEYLIDFSGSADARGDADAIVFPERVTSIRKTVGSLIVFLETYAVYVPGFSLDQDGKPFWERTTIEGADGAVSHRTTTVVENDIYYLTPNKEIKSIRRDFSDQASVFTVAISRKVQKYLDDYIDDNLSGAFGVYDTTKKIYKLHLPKKGEVINTVVLVADVRKVDENGVPEWTIDDGKPFSCGVEYNGLVYMGSSSSGQCYIDEFGGGDDDDVPIISQRVSKKHPAGNPKSIKTYKEVRMYGEMTPSTSIEVFVFIDDVLVREGVITAKNFVAPLSQVGGIGSRSIASFVMGDEGEDIDASTERYTYQYTLRLRGRGRTIQVVTKTNGTNQDHRPAYWEYGIIPTRGEFYPKTEQ